jgi:hypothetical protein
VGGINLCDGLLAYYRSLFQTKKWPVRFNHLVDLVVMICWLVYCRSCYAAGISKKVHLPLISYRIHLGTSLIKFESSVDSVRSEVTLFITL